MNHIARHIVLVTLLAIRMAWCAPEQDAARPADTGMTASTAAATGEAHVLLPLSRDGKTGLLFACSTVMRGSQDVVRVVAEPRGFSGAPCVQESPSFSIGVTAARTIDLAPYVAAAGSEDRVVPRQIRFSHHRSFIKRLDGRFTCEMVVEAHTGTNRWRYTIVRDVPASSRATPYVLDPRAVAPDLTFKAALHDSSIFVGMTSGGCTMNLQVPFVLLVVRDARGSALTNVAGRISDFPFGGGNAPGYSVGVAMPNAASVEAIADFGPLAGLVTNSVSLVPSTLTSRLALSMEARLVIFVVGSIVFVWLVMRTVVSYWLMLAIRRAIAVLHWLLVLPFTVVQHALPILRWLSVLLVCAACSAELVLRSDQGAWWNTSPSMMKWNTSPSVMLYGPLGILFGALVAACVMVALLCRRHRLDKFCLARGLCVAAAWGLFVVYLREDAPAVPPFCSWNDIPAPTGDVQKALATYARICRYTNAQEVTLITDQRANVLLGRFNPDKTNILALAPMIEEWWRTNAAYRDVIATLAAGAAIPSSYNWYLVPYRYPNYLELRSAAEMYWLYALMNAYQGSEAVGVSNLVQMHAVTRKALPHANTYIDKYIWLEIAQGSLRTACEIARMPDTSADSLELLRSAFTPLTAEEVSVKPVFMAMLCDRQTIFDIARTNRNLLASGLPESPLPLKKILYPFVYNPNAALRDSRMFLAPLIEGASLVPMASPDMKQELQWYQARRPIKNYVSHEVVADIQFSDASLMERANAAKVRSDLLALFLARRLGVALEVEDYWSGRPYLPGNQTGVPSSAGEDGIPETEDDIRLDNCTPRI